MSKKKVNKDTIENHTRYISKIIADIYQIIDKLYARNARNENEKLIYAYRGEAKEHLGSELKPSIFRGEEDVKKEMYLSELMSDFKIVEKENTLLEKAIYAQHYVAKSRLLDISFNILPALFFACEKHDEEPGIVYIFSFPETYSPSSEYINNYYSEMLNKKNVFYPKNFKVITQGMIHDRISAQDGGFILFSGDSYNPINEIYYEKYVIDMEIKKSLRKELKLLFGIDKWSVYPEIDNQAERVKEKFNNQNFFHNTISLTSEIDTALKRIEYEYVSQLKKQVDSKQIKRWLRKERMDLINYCAENIENKEKYRKLINQFFDEIVIFN